MARSLEANMHDVFISYAEPNADLANELTSLLKVLGLKPYYAPHSLSESAAADWQQELIEGLKRSRCFVPILTRDSISRRWVLFEAGVAAALKVPALFACVEGVTSEDVNRFPVGGNSLHYRLHDRESLRQLVVVIAKHSKKTQTDVTRIEADFSSRVTAVNRVICMARRMWVFIAGSAPKQRVKENRRTSQVEFSISEFSKNLAGSILRNGLNVSACPQVDDVGAVILREAARVTSESVVCPFTGCDVDYALAGLYPIDLAIRNSEFPDAVKRKWSDHIVKFRRSYLSTMDWIVVVGGNDGTRDEVDAVISLNEERQSQIGICAVSVFGGTASKLVGNKYGGLIVDAAREWRSMDGMAKLIQNVVKVLVGSRTSGVIGR